MAPKILRTEDAQRVLDQAISEIKDYLQANLREWKVPIDIHGSGTEFLT